MSDSHNYTFTWPAGPNEVILTGTFDDWKGSLPLVKTSSGSFEITTPLPEPKEEDDGKIYFKFIVDGDWTVSDNYDKESDGCGFQNNYVDASKITAKGEPANVTRIPEAGGLPATIVAPTSTENNDETVHILPIEEPKTTAVDNIGGPGPVIPEDPANIKEFSEIRDVDADELNERLNKELKAKKESNIAKEDSTTQEQVEEEANQEPEESELEETNDLTATEEKVEEANSEPEEKIEEEARQEVDETNDINGTEENAEEAEQVPEEKVLEETADVNEIEEKVEEPQEIINNEEHQGEDEDHTIEAEIPVIQAEDETKQYDRAPEPLPETKAPTEENKKKETKTPKPVKKATKPIAKTPVKKEEKKPKKGIFGKLKKIFT